ncbi:unnamed protein product [Blepharisma stoltei]|uniref:UBX domain-containing protein n=1 Tax=Blepharisma stoltei TaxID=1481888 RepID=A0AAU9JGC0_9CILI|nr:unnamed protein product [Blepharisma stoltei]
MYSSKLNSNQQEALLNFQAITESYDADVAMELLNKHNFDVISASNEFMSMPRNNYNFQDSMVSDDIQDPLIQDSAYSESSWAIIRYAKWGQQKLVSGISWVFYLAYNYFYPPVRTSEDASAFISILSNYSPRVPFTNLKLQESLSEAQKLRKLLLVYINSFTVPSQWVASVLCSQELTSFLENNFISWGVDQTSPDGRAAILLFQLTQFPCFVVLNPQEINNLHIIKIIKVPIQLNALLNELDLCINGENSILLNGDSELQYERKIRRQQDLELEEAERIVRERYLQEEAKRKQKLKEEEEEEKKERLRKEEAKRQKIEKIGPEPENGDNIAQISFRLPNGQKCERRFYATQTVEILYDFVETLDLSDFEIVINFPLLVLSNKSQTLENAGLFPKSVVHIRELS